MHKFTVQRFPRRLTLLSGQTGQDEITVGYQESVAWLVVMAQGIQSGDKFFGAQP